MTAPTDYRPVSVKMAAALRGMVQDRFWDEPGEWNVYPDRNPTGDFMWLVPKFVALDIAGDLANFSMAEAALLYSELDCFRGDYGVRRKYQDVIDNPAIMSRFSMLLAQRIKELEHQMAKAQAPASKPIPVKAVEGTSGDIMAAIKRGVVRGVTFNGKNSNRKRYKWKEAVDVK